MKKCSLPLLILGCAIVLASAGCINPASSARTTYTIRGRIYDSVTGAGIPGATVSVDSISTRTDAAGNYSFAVDSVSLISGTFGVWKGLDYSFWIIPGVTIDPTRNPEYRIPLRPRNDGSYESGTISGSLPHAATGPAELRVTVRNGNGGFDSASMNLPAGADEYSFQVQTLGTDCLVAFSYKEEGGAELCLYYPNRNLNGPLTLDLNDPSRTPTDVTVSGDSGSQFTADLATAGYGKILDYVPEGEIPAAGSSIAGIYNPDQYPLIWQSFSSQVEADRTYYRHSYSSPTRFSSAVNLPPAPAVHRDPAGLVNVGTAVYDGSALSFAPVAGANMYYVVLEDDNGSGGIIGMIDPSITLPEGFSAEVLEAGQGWDADFRAGWTSIPDSTVFIEYGSGDTNNPENCQVVYVAGPNSVVPDFIP